MKDEAQIAESGGWTFAFSIYRLHEYFMENKCVLEYKHSRRDDGYYSCEINLELQATDQQFTSNGKGFPFKEASQVSACNLVRQLYKANLIGRRGEVKLVTYNSVPFIESISDVKPQVIEVAIKDEQLTLGSNDLLIKTKSFCDRVFEVFGKTTKGSSIKQLNVFCMKQNCIYSFKYFKTSPCGSLLVNCKINLQVRPIAKIFTCEQKANSMKKAKALSIEMLVKKLQEEASILQAEDLELNKK